MTDTASPPPTPAVPVLDRRRIEAELLAPVARRLAGALGAERATALLSAAIAELAEAQGRALRAELGGGGVEGVARLWDRLAAGGALELEVEERSAEAFRFRVTRCRYAEAYRAAGLADLGLVLSCGRDRPLLDGFDPELELVAAGNLLRGDASCCFTYRKRRDT